MIGKYFVLAYLLCAAFFVGKMGWFHGSDSPSSIPVSWSRADLPIVPIVIENERHYVLFNFGSPFDLILNKAVLNGIADKQLTGSKKITFPDSNSKEFSSYLISGSLFGNLSLKNLEVVQMDDDAKMWIHYVPDTEIVMRDPPGLCGEVGRGVLHRTNWILDFAHSTVIPCNNRGELKEKGYYINKMTRIPFSLLESGEIVVAVQTSLGRFTLQLSTSTSRSVIHKARVTKGDYQCNEQGLQEVTVPDFVIGEENLGAQSFILFDYPSNVSKIDGRLGMDFLRNHTIYIDYVEKGLYIE